MDVFARVACRLTSVVLPRDDAGDALKDRRSAAAAPPGDGFVGGGCRSMDAEDLSGAWWCSGEGARSAGLLAGFASLLTRGADDDDVALRLDGCLWLEPLERPLGLHTVTPRVPH